MKAVVQLAEDSVVPKAGAQRLLGYDLARRLEQDEEELEGQLLDLYAVLISQQNASPDPDFEGAEPVAVACELGRLGWDSASSITRRELPSGAADAPQSEILQDLKF